MDSPKEIDEKLNKKLLDDREPINDFFCCASFFQCLSNCCFLLYV